MNPIMNVFKMKILLQTDENGYTMESREYEVKAGKIRIELPKTSATILKAVVDDEDVTEEQ